MKCKKHKIEMKSIPIIKGTKKIGTNYFCPKHGCNYEVNTQEK